jgi:hypothetical protein
MSQGENNQSEIARLRAAIQSEYEAAWSAMYGPAQGLAKHAFITARMERMDNLYVELSRIDEQATDFLVQVMEGAGNQ